MNRRRDETSCGKRSYVLCVAFDGGGGRMVGGGAR